MYNEHCTYFPTLVILNFMESYLQKQLTDSAHWVEVLIEDELV